MYSWKTVLITVGLLFGLKVWNPYFIENIQWSWFDFLHQTHETIAVENIVLVDIDEKSLAGWGQYPIPRGIYGDVLETTDYTNTHIFTQIFAERDREPAEDALFSASLRQRLTILAAAPSLQKDSGIAPFVGTATLGKGDVNQWVWDYSGIVSPIKKLSSASYGVGVTAATPAQSGTANFDGTIRSSPLLVRANDAIYPSLPLELLRAFYDEPSYQLKVSDIGVEWVRMGRQAPIVTTPTADVMISYWNEFQRVSAIDLPNLDLKDKILIWGLTAEGLNNPISTPVGVLYPHEVQANLIQTVLSGVQIQQSYYLEFLEAVLLLSALLIVLAVVYRLPTALAGITSLGIVVSQVGGGYFAWTSSIVLFDTFYSSLASLIIFGHASFNKYYVTYQLKEQIRKQFQKYLSPDMVKQLQDNPELLKLGGDRREMSFMFMDIVGFTPVSEHYKNNDDPEGLVVLINTYLDRMTKIILSYGGTIDKYMGDCIMAFWNAPLPCQNHAQMAVDSAIEIMDASIELNEVFKEKGLPPINIGIGINTGDCIVGNMGSELRFDYSVIGDAVNLASRLEGQTRNYDGVDVLLSESTYMACPNRAFKPVAKIQVKGKSDKIQTYTTLTDKDRVDNVPHGKSLRHLYE